MSKIPQVSLTRCEYNKQRKSLTMPSECIGMPSVFEVVSHHTGEVITFKPVQPGDPMFDEDGFDGEQMIYHPTTFVKNVEYFCIYNQF